MTTQRELKLRYASDVRAVKTGLNDIDKAHQSFGQKLSRTGAKISKTGGTLTRGVTLPIVGLGFAAIKTAGEFEKSMNTMEAVAGVPAPELEKLGDLATDLGAKTVFSANEAAEAMVELAKSGIAPAEIEAGALANTLDLATAGELDLATAAQVAANAMNTFELSGSQSKEAVDALAGAANASSADVSGLAQALAQAGQTAHGAGLSIQETTAVLGLFAQKGLQGSDAGTSLKTMLLSLVPTTDKAKTAIRDLGLRFVDAGGNIRPITEIAEELHTKLGGLTQAQQQVALKTIFGTDAFRAASIVMNAGEKGLRKYTKATNEQGTAAKVAAGKMKGLPGVIESLKGSFETFLLATGKQLAPVVKDVATDLTRLVNKFGKLPESTQKNIVKFGLLAAAAGPVLKIVGGLTRGVGGLIGMFGKLGGALKLSTLATGAWGLAIGLAGVAAFKLHGYLKMDEEQGAKWADQLKAGTVDLEKMRQQVAEYQEQQFFDGLNGENKAVQAMEHAMEDYNRVFNKQVGSIIHGTGVQKKYGEVLRDSSNMTVNQKAKLATLLTVTDRYNVKLSDSQQFTLDAFLAAGNYKGALDLLRRSLKDVLGPLKNALTYTEKQGEAAGDAAQHNRRYVFWLRQVRDSAPGTTPPPGPGIPPQDRHLGGLAMAGRTYLVGERGPELFSPKISGRVIPNNVLAGAGGSREMNVFIFNIDGSVITERQLIDVVHRGLLQKQRRNAGRLGIAS